MRINDTGHVVNNEGITTAPLASPWWLGDANYKVAFDYLVLDNDRVAMHAIYGNTLRQCHSEFFYDVIDCGKALASAQKLVDAATSLLQAHSPDNDLNIERSLDFLTVLANDIAKLRRPSLYIVPNDLTN